VASRDTRPVVIVGAGLGGLTLALALVRKGLPVTVLEQAAALGEVGAGVQISANGARVLDTLGLSPALAEVAFFPEAGEMRHWRTGETLISRPLGEISIARFGFPYYHLHRADFHGVLSDALLTAAPGCVRLSAKVVAVEQDGGSVTAVTEQGERVKGRVLVGADGIHSAIRAELFGADQPRFTGVVAWRATIPVARLPAGHVRPVSSNWIGQGGHFVHYYLRRGELVNCVGCVEHATWAEESWSAEGAKAGFAEDFEGWHEDLQVLIRHAETCFRWGLFDRDPMPAWSAGRVTLLGDACHAMLPFMAQGAVMSIEDAYVLADCLTAIDDPVAALQAYESHRLERTASVQQMSRDNRYLFHDAAAATEEQLAGHRARHEWLYGYDATAVAWRRGLDPSSECRPDSGSLRI